MIKSTFISIYLKFIKSFNEKILKSKVEINIQFQYIFLILVF